jgi:DNA-binding response OmpR family regulator
LEKGAKMENFHEEAMRASGKLCILTVDDAPDVLQSIYHVLHNEYKVFTLPNSELLESFLKKVKPDLFLLDYKMPRLSGFDLVPIIRSFKEHKDTPIIFITSEGTIDNLSVAIALGASDYIVKPFDPKVLIEKVARAVEDRRG